MRLFRNSVLIANLLAIAVLASAFPAHAGKNRVAGTWRIVKAIINPETDNILPYGPDPQGVLVFTPGMTFIEVLHDPRVAKFKSNVRGQGTDEENAAAMAGAIGFYGTYTVDENGEFSGNTVLGSTFPNWNGNVRTTNELRLVVEGDAMRETFTRPSGEKIIIEWKRVE